MALMPPQDAVFLVAESREQPMHVGSLQLFDLPDDAGPDHLTELYRSAVSVDEVAPLFRKRPARGALSAGQWTWRHEEIDLEHHVRHSALASPGRYRELFALTSRLHGTLLDRSRPLWESHLVEGLEGRQFAVYTKMHHALMDGISGLRLLQRSLSEDPEARDVLVPWAARPGTARRSGRRGGLLSLPRDAAGGALSLAGDVVGLTPRVLRLAEQAVRGQAATLPGEAPRSLFNVTISGSRRFAAQSWPLERLRSVGRAAGCTLNDVVLAQCSGALRTYLREQDALPAASLVAMTPVSLRGRGGEPEDDEPSNAVGTVLCRLGTDLDDAGARLAAVHDSMTAAKAALRGLNQTQVTALSAVVMAPLLFNELVALHTFSRPPFNLVISNVPGPPDPLYWNGARLRGLYPLSIPTHGQALNITLTSYAGQVHYGLVGCRRSVPHLQRLLAHLEDALVELEDAVR